MAAGWAGSSRSRRLPSDWPRRRARVLRRDGHRCCHIEDGQRCPNSRATGHHLEVDHIVRGDNHELANLQTLCVAHHQAKTIAERRPPRHRPAEPHPGEL